MAPLLKCAGIGDIAPVGEPPAARGSPVPNDMRAGVDEPVEADMGR